MRCFVCSVDGMEATIAAMDDDAAKKKLVHSEAKKGRMVFAPFLNQIERLYAVNGVGEGTCKLRGCTAISPATMLPKANYMTVHCDS